MLPKTIVVFANYKLNFFYDTQNEVDEIISSRKIIFRGSSSKAKRYICSCINADKIDSLAKVLFKHLSKI